jgi:hypothetical protein
MLRNVSGVLGYTINAVDGAIGTVDDFYFDDDDWSIRYLVVDTGSWLSVRNVLISPGAIRHPDWMDRVLPVSLTRDQVARRPDIAVRQPMSGQPEAEYSTNDRHPAYWGGAGLWGMGAYPGSLTTEDRIEATLKAHHAHPRPASGDSHLRSTNAIIDHHIEATDGGIGHLKDLILDDHAWVIRYLVVTTSNWWGDHDVLVAPEWIGDVSWLEATVSVDLTRQAIKDAPRYDTAAGLDRQQEQRVYEHYGRPGYWTIETSERLPIHDGGS